MIPSALEYFACPHCASSPLRHAADENLLCETCASLYPVRNGIPRFVPADNYAESFGYQWNLHRRTQLDSNTGLPISRQRVFEVTGWPEKLDGEVMLEAGCGAGRFTEILLGTGATVFSFDYSAAVDANSANNGSHASLQLFQADIFNIPLRERAFDKVFCLGVLQHTPDPAKAFASLARYVKPGGELVIDIYAKRLSAVLSWKYLLRPITRRLDQQRLHRIIEIAVPALAPISAALRRVAGRAGARLLPIVEYSHLGLPRELNKEWAILDTFDMYAPAHDHPQSPATVKRWFETAGLIDITVRYGPNGIIGKGIMPVRGNR
jgi:SAM-dependent methyltransferase